MTDRERAGEEPQRKKGQFWIVRRGAKRQWLYVTEKKNFQPSFFDLKEISHIAKTGHKSLVYKFKNQK